jgi:beta-1,3-galactosyltransferase 1/2/3/4/5/7/8
LILIHFFFARDIDKTISHLEMELAAARAAQESLLNGAPLSDDLNFKFSESRERSKYLMVIGINTAFSSRKRRDSIRGTWMPQGTNINFSVNFI